MIFINCFEMFLYLLTKSLLISATETTASSSETPSEGLALSVTRRSAVPVVASVVISSAISLGSSAVFGLLSPGSGRLGLDLSFQSRRHYLWRQMKEIPQILDAFVGEIPVEVTPRELLLHVTPALQRLQRLNHVEVRDLLERRVFGCVEVLLGHHHALLEEVLVDRNPVLLGHQHCQQQSVSLLVKMW